MSQNEWTRADIEKAIHEVVSETVDAVLAVFVPGSPLDPTEAKAQELWEASMTDGDPDWSGLIWMTNDVDDMSREFARTDVDRFRALARYIITGTKENQA